MDSDDEPDPLDGMVLEELNAYALTSRECARTVHNAKDRFPAPKLSIFITSGDCTIYMQSDQIDENYDVKWSIKDTIDFHGRTKTHKLGRLEVLSPENCYDSSPISLARVGEKDKVIDAIIRHILFVFPKCTIGHVDISSPYMRTVEFSPQIALDLVTRAESVKIHTRDFREVTSFVLRQIEITKSYENESPLYIGEQTMPRLNCTDLINCKNASWMTSVTLLKLNCKTIILHKTEFCKEHLVQFILKWKNFPNKYANRTDVEIEYPLDVKALDWKKLEAKPWDPECMEKDYQRVGTGTNHTFTSNAMLISGSTKQVLVAEQHIVEGYRRMLSISVWLRLKPDT